MRKLIENQCLGFVRSAIFEWEVRRESRHVFTQARLQGVSVIDIADLKSAIRGARQAETFFILGSGSSVRGLGAKDFAEIASHVSVGINTWGIHDFVPDMFAFENVSSVGDGRDFARALKLLEREDIVAAKPSLLVLRPANKDRHDELHNVPAELFSQVLYYGRVSPSTRSLGNLAGDFSKHATTLHRYGGHILLDSGASVVRMLGLGLAMGFQNIVLVGVDLRGGNYFWEDNEEYASRLRDVKLVNNQRFPRHETTTTDTRPFSVVDMVQTISRVAESLYGSRVFVASRDSELADFLPIYPWSSSSD